MATVKVNMAKQNLVKSQNLDLPFVRKTVNMFVFIITAKKTLSELRQLYFRLKDEVFGKTKGGVSFNTAGLEKILKEEFTETRCMDDETYPRYDAMHDCYNNIWGLAE